MCSAETRARCLLDGVVGVAATLVTVFLSIVLLRWRKVTREHRRCFQRIEQAGYHSDKLLRCLDKAITLSVPPVSGTNGLQSKPLKKGLVLIGGFGDMPFMWEGLSERASKAGWYTLAPRTPGWGRIDFEEVNHVSWRDWVLACRDAVTVVRGLCTEVTVVAHSTGAPVAALVAEILPIDRLIFTGPNFVSQASDRWTSSYTRVVPATPRIDFLRGGLPFGDLSFDSRPLNVAAQKLLLLPIVGPLVALCLDTVVKKKRRGRPVDNLNEAAYPTAFYLTCFPIRPLRQMWMLQSQLSRPWKVSEEVIMIMGESDGSVAPLPEQVEKIQPFLPKDVPFRACSIPDAGHGLPTETERVVNTLASVVLGDMVDRLTRLAESTEEVATSQGVSGS